MVTAIKNELNKYHQLNGIAERNCVVCFGSDSFSRVPFTELSHSFCIDTPVYNRSITGLSIYNCENVLKECIFELCPSKIFLNIGEEDIKSKDFDCEKFISAYEWLLYTVHSHCKGRIYVVSITGENSKINYVNERLRSIAQNAGCKFIDISSTKGKNQVEEMKIFEVIRYYLRSKNYSLSEIFSLA